MKKIVTFMAIAMIGLFVFSGCSKKSDSPSYTMKATVGTTVFSVSNCLGSITGGTLSIYGYSGSGSTVSYPNIILGDFSYTAPGTFTVDTTGTTLGVTMAYSPSSDPTATKSAKTGTLTVSTVTSTTITGTFSFTCTDGTVVSGGTFTAKKY